MATVIIPKVKIEKAKGVVILPLKEYERLRGLELRHLADKDLRAALDDLKAGRVHGPFRNAKEGIRFLRRR